MHSLRLAMRRLRCASSIHALRASLAKPAISPSSAVRRRSRDGAAACAPTWSSCCCRIDSLMVAWTAAEVSQSFSPPLSSWWKLSSWDWKLSWAASRLPSLLWIDTTSSLSSSLAAFSFAAAGFFSLPSVVAQQSSSSPSSARLNPSANAPAREDFRPPEAPSPAAASASSLSNVAAALASFLRHSLSRWTRIFFAALRSAPPPVPSSSPPSSPPRQSRSLRWRLLMSSRLLTSGIAPSNTTTGRMRWYSSLISLSRKIRTCGRFGSGRPVSGSRHAFEIWQRGNM